MSAEPILENVIVPHPDTSPDQPGSKTAKRLLAGADGSILCVFADGDITTVDIAGQAHAAFSSFGRAG